MKSCPNFHYNHQRFRYLKITSSNAFRLLHKSQNIEEILDPDIIIDDCSNQFLIEKSLKFLFSKIIFSTGIWTDSQLFWLTTRPDGLTLYDKMLIPVEIKSIRSEKTVKCIINEYYSQLQLHMRVVQSEKLMFILHSQKTNEVSLFLVNRDEDYLNEFLMRIELKYFEVLPRFLLKNINEEMREKLIQSNEYKNYCFKLNHKDQQFDKITEEKIPKKIQFKEYECDIKLLTKFGNRSAFELEEMIKKQNENLFKKNYLNFYVFDKLFGFVQEINRFSKVLKVMKEVRFLSRMKK